VTALFVENVLSLPYAENRVDNPHDPSTLTPPSAHAERADAGLVEACRSGHTAAFERLFHLHGPKMKSIAYNLLGSTHDAEDAVQEAFLKIYRGIGGFKGQSAFSTWVYRILVNACYDMRRRGLRQVDTVAPAEDSDDQPVDYAPAPTANHPLRLALEKSVQQLTEAQRSVFLLYEVEGFSHAEIGAMLGISEGASKNRLFEAKRELRRRLTASSAAGKPVESEDRP
jgi:RNA polymerase sigma-70 factor (ECF subfamily)